MMEDTLILLRFNCPDQSCDYIASGWGDLKLHVRAVHGKLMWLVQLVEINFGSLITEVPQRSLHPV